MDDKKNVKSIILGVRFNMYVRRITICNELEKNNG